ncbi:AI-2E family transporter, partial [Chloroflexota bacterium]
ITAACLVAVYALRAVILPFAVGLVLAYVLSPIISWVELKLPSWKKHAGVKRVAVIFVVFLVTLGVVAVFLYFLITVLVETSILLLDRAPQLVSHSVQQVQQWLEVVREQLPLEFRLELDKTLVDAGLFLGNSARDAVMEGISFVPRNLGMIFGFAALPFFLFYILKDAEKLKKGIVDMLSPTVAWHAANVTRIVEKVLGRYLRAQVMLGLIVAYFAFLGLLFLLGFKNASYAAVLAVLAGITELIPTLGPWIGGGVAVIVTLAIAPEKVIWVAILYVAIQVVENYLLVPRIQSAFLKIHPAVMIVLLVIGAYLAGFWGLLLIAPVTATFIEVFKYARVQYIGQPDTMPPSGAMLGDT